MAKVPLLKRWMEKASKAAIERSNPELASAMRKLEPHAKQLHDPQQAQKAMSQLTRQERAALLEMQEQQGGGPSPRRRTARCAARSRSSRSAARRALRHRAPRADTSAASERCSSKQRRADPDVGLDVRPRGRS